ncbi:homocysteine-responsive endoplasmic reticulum-resident ubiquitin-like domain member 2 protein isoform X1 [Hemibagrus wyckioides]|uniref:homocysteine-responsive endoplasmic reticulum-resident ubiquitin-like domain member 2 protein isoform X1 n=1 Tax=Hemibagrus wyckioides TaxID=337641 RepID=UPI00266D95F5|nr:homocysteine-responsive endoplasmic reticulum-resident ubiquitin-like domain member 2 protein isoform X1 [Hemibagrus wyckioides]
MEQGVVDSPVVLVIKAPDQKYDDQTISCFLNWTVEKLKSHLSNVYPSKPRSKDQRLVYSGKLLQDHCKLRDVLRKHDEFHMLHLVCASRSPPPSPSTRRSQGSNQPMSSTSSRSPASRDNVQSASSEEAPDRLSLSSSSSYPHPTAHRMMSVFCVVCRSAWTQWFNQQQHNTHTPHYPMYNPHTLLWWQQLYTWHFHMTYQTWVASLRPSQQSATPPVPPIGEAQAVAHDNPRNGPAGAGLNEEDLHRDWLDWVYAASRALVLLSLVYFYSSFSRFVMVTGAMLLLYLHQAGWLPFNLDNELQDLAEPANHNQDEPVADNLNNTDRLADEGEEEEEQQEGPDDDDDYDEDDDDDDNEEGWVNLGLLSSAWSFITTFFASLIPEAVPNAVN